MKNLKKIAATIAVSTILSSSAYADDIVAIGPKIGLEGFGLEARTPLMDNLLGRVGINYLGYSYNADLGELDLKAQITLLIVPVMLDWHPIDNSGFRLSAGVAYNGNKVTGKAAATKSVTLNKVSYTAAQIGSVSTTLTLGNKIAPVATLGYDGSFLEGSALSFNFEAGVMFAGSPKLSISSNGTGGDAVKANIKKSVDTGLDAWKKYLRLFPILSVGFKYSF